VNPNRRATAALAIGAGLVTLVLTGAGFWLSYDHLHHIAGGHGLTGNGAWAWPGTIDGFILVGESLFLRASLKGYVDRWAIALAALGSIGSVALNISGVGGGASSLDYIVAAVPPTAALIAFGALMRQVHDALERIQGAPVPVVLPDAPDAFDRAAAEATALAPPASAAPASSEVTPDAHPADAPAAERTVPAPTASDNELIDQARALAEHGPLSLRRMQRELGIGQARATRIRDALDKEAS
jgi:hypothetical protein